MRASQNGLLKRIARFPGRLMRGADTDANVQSRNSQQAGKPGIASDWVHFLLEESEGGSSSARADEQIASAAPASLAATPRAAPPGQQTSPSAAHHRAAGVPV